MTDTEIKLILQELHGAGLVNEPKDPKSTIKIWLDFFGGDDFRVIGKAVGMHLKKSHFWPAPADLEKLKTKARWLVEMEDEEIRKKKDLSVAIRELHELNLIGEPENLTEEVNAWYRWFNSNSIEQVRTAVTRYLDVSGDWPTPSELYALLPTVEEQKKLNALGGATHTIYKKIKHKQSSTVPPRVPAISIADQEQTFCQLCGLCDIKDQSKCPMDG